MYTSTEVYGVQGSGRFLFCTHWLNPLDNKIFWISKTNIFDYVQDMQDIMSETMTLTDRDTVYVKHSSSIHQE